MSFLPAWIVGLFFIAAIGLSDGKSYRLRKIIAYEDQICEPGKRHVSVNDCAECTCKDHGYGSVCKMGDCKRGHVRPLDLRECTPHIEFITTCHFCKCSPFGIPADCIEKNDRCMDDILEDLDDQRSKDENDSMESDNEDYDSRDYLLDETSLLK